MYRKTLPKIRNNNLFDSQGPPGVCSVRSDGRRAEPVGQTDVGGALSSVFGPVQPDRPMIDQIGARTLRVLGGPINVAIRPQGFRREASGRPRGRAPISIIYLTAESARANLKSTAVPRSTVGTIRLVKKAQCAEQSVGRHEPFLFTRQNNARPKSKPE